MANTYVDYTAVASQTDYNFSFEYLRDEHVKVKVDGTLVTNYTIVTSPTPTKIRFNTAPDAGAAIKIYRDSRGDFSPLVDFVDGSVLTENELDESYKHNLFVSQESSEGTGGEQLTKKGLTHYDAEGNKIINLGTPTTSTDAANKGYVDQTIDNAIALGGSPAIVSLGGYDVTAFGTSITRSLAEWTNDLATGDLEVTATGSTTARTLADRFADVVNASDFGAVGDGSTDDTSAIQAAVNAARVVNFESLTYKIEGTVEVPDNTWLCGKPGTEFLGIMTAEGSGGYPNQMFRNADTVSGNNNISFTNIKFNFAKGSYNYDSGAALTSINSLLFVLVENLVFQDCEFFDFVTNQNTGLLGKDLLKFGMAQFDNCARVSFERISNENIREEGFNFYECFQVSFNNWRGRGDAVNTSSHAGIWYCDVVSVRNARFTHTGGSVLNCCSRNVLYENITVNENQTQDGRGFDFGNELDARAFDIGNISVVGCTLNVTDYGVYLQGGATHNDICESINIENNRFYIAEDNVSYGIRLLSPKAATIQNNFIYLSDVTAAGDGVCVILSLLETTQDSDYTTNIKITNNYMRGMTGVYMLQNNDTSVDGLYVESNTFVSQDNPLIGSVRQFSTFSGASVFMYFRNNLSAVSDFDISNVYIQNNNCWNLGGGYFVMSIDDPAEIVLNNINIIGNRFIGDSDNMDRSFTINGGTGGSGNADIRICNNTIENGNTININNMKYVLVDRNVYRWDTEFTSKRVQITSHNGTFEMVDNRFYNVSQATSEDVTQTTCTFDILQITGNSSKNASGTLAWTKSTLPTNTTLPN